VVRFCRANGLSIHTRGQGHTQSGQACSDGKVLLDMSAMQTIHAVDTHEGWALVDGGVIWRDLVAKTVPMGWVPRVLTNNLGVSVAGTTSVAGLGVASFRYGSQADNAIELEVVTGTGEIVHCSREQNRDLFDVARCGFGQFGVITKVKTRLRPCKQRCACGTCCTTTSAPSCATRSSSCARATSVSTRSNRAAHRAPSSPSGSARDEPRDRSADVRLLVVPDVPHRRVRRGREPERRRAPQ
jgi:FAD/FMN-containing dehydrogenase